MVDNDILDKKPDDIPDLDPLYGLDGKRTRFQLGEFDATLAIDDKGYPGIVKVEVDLVDSGVMFLHGKFKNITKKKIKDGVLKDKEKTFLSINEIQLDNEDIDLLEAKLNSKNELHVSWLELSDSMLVKGNGAEQDIKLVKMAKFHLFNFCNFDGEIKYKEGKKVIDHVKLESENWKIHLASTKATEDNIELLSTGTGHGLTHVGEISNKKGELFATEELGDILIQLDMLFNFVRGRFCSVGFVQAYDVKGNVVWEELNSPEPRGDYESDNWFSVAQYKLLQDIFPGFIKISSKKKWQENMPEAIRWYYLSNSNHDIGTSIILTQTALELLAYQHAAIEKKLISHKGFTENSFKASDKLHLLFSSLDIPLNIPPEVKDIKKAKKGKGKWQNSPEALVAVRNSLVHPKDNEKKYRDILEDISDLGLWYLELTVLAICGYNGQYYNRLSQKSKNVPWFSKSKELRKVTKQRDSLVKKIRIEKEKNAKLKSKISSAKKSPTKKSPTKKAPTKKSASKKPKPKKL